MKSGEVAFPKSHGYEVLRARIRTLAFWLWRRGSRMFKAPLWRAAYCIFRTATASIHLENQGLGWWGADKWRCWEMRHERKLELGHRIHSFQYPLQRPSQKTLEVFYERGVSCDAELVRIHYKRLWSYDLFLLVELWRDFSVVDLVCALQEMTVELWTVGYACPNKAQRNTKWNSRVYLSFTGRG